MTPKLPIISGRQAVRAFECIGYRVVRQRGSHIRLRHDGDQNHQPLTVPDHPTLKPGLLHQLLRDANLSVDEFIALLK